MDKMKELYEKVTGDDALQTKSGENDPERKENAEMSEEELDVIAGGFAMPNINSLINGSSGWGCYTSELRQFDGNDMRCIR